MRQPSLAAEIKAQIVTLLKEHYPDFFKYFHWRTERWSTGGAVDIMWIDGPSREEIQALLAPLKKTTSIYIDLQRDHSFFFLTCIAKEVCTREGWELPKIESTPEGRAYIGNLCLDHIYRGIYEKIDKTSTLAEKKG